MKTIIEDTKQKVGHHQNKNNYFKEQGINCVRCALPYGDYVVAPKVAIDTKQDISEMAMNLCGRGDEKKRLIKEMSSAKESGAKLIFLIEDKRFNTIEDLFGQRIYLHSGRTIKGDQVAKGMFIAMNYYGCEFMFCDPAETGRMIVELLEE